jgi:predicted ATP-dependent endonuclease of OLD family
MKITGIDISDYRQFRNLNFDFTYPADHPNPTKAGQPLDKVCFIGQSGTGKTTLLRVIWEFLEAINLVVSAKGQLQDESSFENGYVPESVSEIKLSVQIGESPTVVDTKYKIQASEIEYLNNWYSEKLSISDQFQLKDTKKFCLFIKDSIIQEADNFLAEQFKGIAKTESQIEIEKQSRWDLINKVGNQKIIQLGDGKSPLIWRYLLKEIYQYNDTGLELARNVLEKNGALPLEELMLRLDSWRENTTNPRTDLAERCLNPILKKIHLEMDTISVEVPIVIKTQTGFKPDSSYLSTGIRQILATAIPIYKFDTTDTVILFDEPERSLFPDVQRELVDYYVRLAPTAQFFFATHSPIIAASFEPCERFILFFNEDGEVDFHRGVAPEGDDPNDILSEDFGMSTLMGEKGLEAYQRYRNLFVEIKNEQDPERKQALVVKQAKLSDQYNF